QIKTSNDWWLWCKSVVLQELRAQRSYNNKAPYGLKGFLEDRANRIMGYAIIRQVRSKRHNCEVPQYVDSVIKTCSGSRDVQNEDSKDFCAGWNHNETFYGACQWKEFKYQTATELGTYTSWGRLGWYGGGGYVLRLSGPQSAVINRMDMLQQKNWVDKNTRALILEFSVYNSNVNLFTICTVSAEFNEGGGIIPKWRFEPIKLIKSDDVQSYLVYAYEVIFVIIMVLFTLKELWEIKKLKLSYFDSYWNIAELILLIVSYTTIGMYFYRYAVTLEALNVFNETFGNGYVRMDSAAVIDQYYLYGMAIIIFFSTLKLIKLLQFNKRMGVLASTIGLCWEELKIFLIAFAIIFFAFSCLFFFMFTANLEEFNLMLSSIQTSFSMMMGKFDFKAMNEVNSLSPILFFVFSVTNNMILINIMLTIIIQAFHDVTQNLEKKENKLDLIDYVWTSFRQTIRKENLPKIHVEPKLTDKITKKVEPADEGSEILPDKVGELLKYINEMYFDGKLDMRDQNMGKKLLMKSDQSRFIPLNEEGLPIRRVLSSDN
ncbi:UNVERIFIED_CONTAM: hypothetical protein GTU68_050043, partial [Idotea baltica]|nr:hypothetical protein [Idotea baltica]